MVTSKAEDQDVIESLKKGANDFIVKPFHFDVVLRRLKTQLTISAQSKAMAKAKELSAVQALVVTYSHEINNPLAIAIGFLHKFQQDQDQKHLPRIEIALRRIAELVSKIRKISETKNIEYQDYGGNAEHKKIKIS
jgi:DNA-binding response OmpR family regulator